MYIAISTIILVIIIVSAILFYISVKSFYKKKKDSIPLEYLQSMNYLLSEQHDKALDKFMSMVGLNQDTAETHIILGNLFRNRGEVDRAIRIHQNLIARPELKPDFKNECSLELAKDFLKAGFLDRAELILSRLSSEVDSPAEILNYLKEIYESEKDWKKAIEITTKIQSINKKDYSDILSHYYCELAELELIAPTHERSEKAKKYINKALNCNKNSFRASMLQGDLYFLNRDFSSALKRYLFVYENYEENSYLVIKKLKNTYNSLERKENFFTFIKNISDVANPIDLYSYLNSESKDEISNIDITNLYEEEFRKGNATLTQLSEYLDLIDKNKIAFDNKSLNNIKKCLDYYKAKESTHECINCGFKSITHYWQCPSCQNWSSIKRKILNKHKTDHYVV